MAIQRDMIWRASLAGLGIFVSVLIGGRAFFGQKFNDVLFTRNGLDGRTWHDINHNSSQEKLSAEIHSIDDKIQAAFDRDFLFDDILSMRNSKYTPFQNLYSQFNNLANETGVPQGPANFSDFEVELLSLNSSNGIKILLDDPKQLTNRLHSPKTIQDLPPVLVCDYIVFGGLIGDTKVYDELIKWRTAYWDQHPKACQLKFTITTPLERGVAYYSAMFLKLSSHLFLIKAISDGRIVTSDKYNELLQSGMILTTPSSGQLQLTHSDDSSVQKFIKLLTPHVHSGIGIPSGTNMTQYPLIFYLDQDTLVTNKSITVNSFLQQVDRGLHLPQSLPSAESEAAVDGMPASSEDVDFIIGNDMDGCSGPDVTLNAGVHISRPSAATAELLWSAISLFKTDRDKWDQGAIIKSIGEMTQYNNSEMMRYNEERKRLQEAPGERLLFISPSNKNATSLQHRAVIELLSKMNNERLERIDKVWGPFEDAPVGSRMALLAVVDGRWMNSAGSDVPGLVWLTLWQPGDWIAHFIWFIIEKEVTLRVRRWVCDHLGAVSHPENVNCSRLVEEGFTYGLIELDS